jgi:hypothetical protein
MTQQFLDKSDGTGALQASAGGKDAAAIARVDPGEWVRRFVMNLSAHDWLILGYFVVVLVALIFGSGPGRPACIERVVVDILLLGLGLLLSRGGVFAQGSFLNSFTYRMTLFAAVFLSYFQLRNILPAVSSRTVDAEILAFDQHVFGVEPSLAWDKYVNSTTTEWFAFFYFSYFAILAIHVIPFLLGGKDNKLISQFALGIFVVFCSAHTLYMVVPGYGPYAHMADQFKHELSGGLFWGLVKDAVEAGGAQKDIFPSLHTAAPTFLAIFSFRHRHILPFKYTWPIVAFFASQIIVATMFLRWHYLIDIFAGITLASLANLAAAKVCGWEADLRERRGVAPVFSPLRFPRP